MMVASRYVSYTTLVSKSLILDEIMLKYKFIKSQWPLHCKLIFKELICVQYKFKNMKIILYYIILYYIIG